MGGVRGSGTGSRVRRKSWSRLRTLWMTSSSTTRKWWGRILVPGACRWNRKGVGWDRGKPAPVGDRGVRGFFRGFLAMFFSKLCWAHTGHTDNISCHNETRREICPSPSPFQAVVARETLTRRLLVIPVYLAFANRLPSPTETFISTTDCVVH